MTRRKILVPINFTKESDEALSYAGQIAESMNEMISCLYVIEDQDHSIVEGVSVEAKHKMRREAEQKLSKRVNEIFSEAPRTEFEIIITSGNVHEKVIEKAIDLDARLIVMGKSNANKKKEEKLGSNTQQIILKSPVPVITICDSNTSGIKNLVLPLDLIDSNTRSINQAIEFALKLPLNLIIVSIVPKGMEPLRKIFQIKLDDMKKLLENLEIPCETYLINENTTIPDEIISFSRNIEKGFIMLMTRDISKDQKCSLGPTAKEIILSSRMPIFSFNPAMYTNIIKKDSDFINSTYN